MTKLKDKVAVITGGSSGIGLATAQRFVAEGAYVFIVGRRQTELDKAKALIGKNVATVQGDVANLNDLDRLYETIKKEKGVLHIVVASAGITELATPSTATPEHYDKVFNTNARGTFFTIQKAVPLMTTGGSIVTVGSVAYKKGLPPMTVYSSTKAAIRYSVKGWAADLIGKGIRVNNFSPGVTDTPMLDSQHGTQEESDALRRRWPRRSSSSPRTRAASPRASTWPPTAAWRSFDSCCCLPADRWTGRAMTRCA
jgi:NAD(P)-dependent dehydrogenase (short-subunit alcohol dehydrogenase family)